MAVAPPYSQIHTSLIKEERYGSAIQENIVSG